MPETFLHGVEVVEIDAGPRPIQTVRSAVIGLVGTAPNADAAAFPLNKPVLVAGSRTQAAKLDTVGTKLGTLPAAIDGIFDQAGAMVVVIRVDVGADDAATLSNVIGGVDAQTGAYTGVHALLGAQGYVGLTPKILIAPGFTSKVTRDVGQVITGAPVVTELLAIADRLRAIIVADGPNTNDADALAFRSLFASARVYLVDPWVKVWDTVAAGEAQEPGSARVAGLIARVDNELGYWWSPSNQEIYGITGAARPVEFAFGDPNARANYLNEHQVATIIQQDGYRLWGNRACSSDPKWAFLSVRRVADMVNESLLLAHLWAVDRNITKTYVEDVVEGVRAFLRHLKAVGAIIDGDCWADPELNTPTEIAAGKAYFDFDFTPPYPAEHVTFRSHLVDDYLVDVLPTA